jgi:hypothetical protein
MVDNETVWNNVIFAVIPAVVPEHLDTGLTFVVA